MGTALIIISIVLIIASLVLLLVSPLALIGVVLGIAGIIYGKNYKPIEVKIPEKPTPKEPERVVREHSKVFEIIGVAADSLGEYISDREEFDNASVYDRGERVFKYTYDFPNVSVEGGKVLVNGKELGSLRQNAIDFISERECRFNITAEYGDYVDVVKNPEADYDYEDNIFKYGEKETPEVMLYVIYKE